MRRGERGETLSIESLGLRGSSPRRPSLTYPKVLWSSYRAFV